jgi:hypothetical protein
MTTTKALECWYFGDGDQALIRVVTQSPIARCIAAITAMTSASSTGM